MIFAIWSTCEQEQQYYISPKGKSLWIETFNKTHTHTHVYIYIYILSRSDP